MEKGVKLFNYVRQESSQIFKDIVPTATSENIMTISNILFSDNYEGSKNTGYHAFFNHVGGGCLCSGCRFG